MNTGVWTALACSALLLVSESAAASPVWISGINIKEIYSSGADGYVLTLSANPSTCTNAQTPDKFFYVSPTATPNGYTLTENGVRNMLALAMQAAATNTTVDVLFDSATTYCYVAALIIHNSNY